MLQSASVNIGVCRGLSKKSTLTKFAWCVHNAAKHETCTTHRKLLCYGSPTDQVEQACFLLLFFSSKGVIAFSDDKATCEKIMCLVWRVTEAPNEGGNDRGKAIAPGDNRGIITPDVVPRTARRYILQAGAKITADAHTEEQKGCRGDRKLSPHLDLWGFARPPPGNCVTLHKCVTYSSHLSFLAPELWSPLVQRHRLP